MTCIVGLVNQGEVWMGADSAGVDDDGRMVTRNDAKVFRNGPYLFGFTDSFRMGQLLRWKLDPPTLEPGEVLERFMATRWIDAVRDCLYDGGFSRKDDGVETGGEFLVGHAGRLFLVASDFQVGENSEPWNACGSGSQVAMGSLFSSRWLAGHPEDRIRLALSAAERYCASVRGPFIVMRERINGED